MVSLEVTNFTQTSAAYETTTSAPLTRIAKIAGIFNAKTQKEKA